jgi:RHS repeat-associated protein
LHPLFGCGLLRWDNIGNRTEIDLETDDDNDVSYTYNALKTMQLDSSTDESGIMWSFTYDANGNMLMKSGNGITWTYALEFHLLDHLGSRQVVCDSAGRKKGGSDGDVRYSTFGEYEGGAEGEYSYTGKQRDGETGLSYFNARFYDPAIGRFTAMDPIKDGVNWYVYCRNNPLRYVDPNGLEVVINDDMIVKTSGRRISHKIF